MSRAVVGLVVGQTFQVRQTGWGYWMRALGLALSFIALVPATALACPVCGLAGTQDNWLAYGAMSVMLSVLPLAMIGGVVFWVYRRSK